MHCGVRLTLPFSHSTYAACSFSSPSTGFDVVVERRHVSRGCDVLMFTEGYCIYMKSLLSTRIGFNQFPMHYATGDRRYEFLETENKRVTVIKVRRDDKYRDDEAKWMRKMLLSYLGPDAFARHYAITMDVVTRRHIKNHWQEPRPIIETLKYTNQHKKLLESVLLDKLKLDGEVELEEEAATEEIIRGYKALRENNDLGVFVLPIRLE
ncbi:hypothetical protein Tco_1366355, partial [Tanacetum coccineum]